MLQGIWVVEFEGIGPAPFAAMMLAEMGASVTVIHRSRESASPVQPDRSLLDRGKRSIVLNLKDHGDLDLARELIARSDILIEGLRPGVMERLGLGPAESHRNNPALVYGRMTGWGQTGLMAERAGHDLNYLALSGALWYASRPGEAPVTPPTLLGDIGGGALYLVAGVLAGFVRAKATGQGTVVDAAIYDGSAHMMTLLMSLAQTGNLSDSRGQSLLDGPHWCRTYRCADNGFISVQCLEPKFYAEFLSRLGLGDDPEFAAPYDRQKWPDLTRRLEDLFARRNRDDWAALFDGSDACVAPVLSPSEAELHPMNSARMTWGKDEDMLCPAPAPRFSGYDRNPGLRPCRDQHRQEILAELARPDTGDC
ncbi:MAG: CaiB/BaiF CoA-transferase family protein [Pseudomonadota bacterium]